MRQCEVYLHGIKAGVLIENDNREFMFTYDKAYLLSENCDAVSLTLPLRSEPYSSPFLFSVFANMLSEGTIAKYNLNYFVLILKMILEYYWLLVNMIPLEPLPLNR